MQTMTATEVKHQIKALLATVANTSTASTKTGGIVSMQREDGSMITLVEFIRLGASIVYQVRWSTDALRV